MSITMKEIAKLARVHRTTVSRAFNNYPQINPRTRERVLSLMKKHNFTLNRTAVKLCREKTFTIGIVFPTLKFSDMDSYTFGEILRGAGTAINHAPMYDLLMKHGIENQEEMDYVKYFAEKRVDGLIIVFPEINNPQRIVLEKKKYPVVLISSVSPSLDYVRIDNAGGIAELTAHLVSLGHKRIAMIRGKGRLSDYDERFEAYRHALLRHSLPFEEELVEIDDSTNGKYTEISGVTAMKRLLGSGPTAVIACDDTAAFGAVKVIKEAGLTVPGDIAVAGFDDIPRAEHLDPPLTTVKQSFFEIGKKAGELVLSRIENKSQPQQIARVPVRLVIRQSTMEEKK